MAEENDKYLLKVDIDYDALTVKIAKAKQSIAGLKDENKKLTDQANKALKEGVVAQYEELNRQIVINEASIRDLSREQKNAQKTQDLVNQSNKAAAGSYEQLLRQQQLAQTNLKLLEGTLKKNADGTFQLTDEYKKAAEQVKTAKEAIIAFDQGIKDGRTNVGNYASSLSEALEKTGLFSGALGSVREALNGVKAGQQVVAEGFNLMKAGLDATGQGFQKLLQTFLALPNASKGVKDAAEGVTEVADAAGELGSAAPKIEAVGAVGGRALNIIKIGIASTGIGLLLVALGSLVAYFQKSEAASELLGRSWAGLKAIVSVFTNTLADFGEVLFKAFENPKQALIDLANFIGDQFINRVKAYGVILQGIADFDGKKVANGFSQMVTGVENFNDKMGDYAKKSADAAKEAFKLEGAQQQLEDRIRQTSVEINVNNNRIEKALKLSKDATISIKERKAALEEASKLEERNAELNATNAAQQLALDVQRTLVAKNLTAEEKKRFQELVTSQKTLNALQQEELDTLQERGKISDDELQKITETAIEKNNIIANAEETRLLIAKRYNKFLADEQRKAITATVGILEDELKMKELAGQKDFELRRDIARRQTQELLLNDELTAKERERIQSGLKLKLAEIAKEETDFLLKLKEEQEDALIGMIVNGKDREIAAEAVQLERKLATITGNTKQEADLRAVLIEQSSLKIQQIEEKYAKETLAKLIAIEDQRTTKEVTAANERFTAKDNALRLQLANEEITQQEYDQRKNDALLEQQAQELFAVEKTLKNRGALIAQTYANESAQLATKLAEGTITEKQYADELVRIDDERLKEQERLQDEFGVRVTEKRKQLAQTEVNIQIEASNKNKQTVKQWTAYKQQMADIEIGIGQSILSATRNALMQQTSELKALAFVIKGLALAEIYINLQKELSANAVAAAASPLNALGPAGVAAAQAQLVAVNTASYVRAGIAAASVLIQKFEEGGLTADQSGGSAPKTRGAGLVEVLAQYRPDFTDQPGGMVYRPTLWNSEPGKMNLAGEAGPEWVASNWMLKDPVSAPLIANLEAYRKTKVLPFADGGFTVSAAMGVPTIYTQGITIEDLTAALDLMKQPVLFIDDLKDVEDRITQTEVRANI